MTTMTELSFAKSFLTTLDSYPSSLSADHVETPKNYPARPLFTLPKSTQPPLAKRKTGHNAPSEIIVRLKSFRNPPLDYTLSSQLPTTSILEIKESLSGLTNIPVKKIRLLFNKKPVAESSVINNLLTERDGVTSATLELSVVVLGSAAPLNVSSTSGAKSEESDTKPEKTQNMLDTEIFWLDLKEFLVKRLEDKHAGEKLWKVFRTAFEAEK
ncbi:hypothetical protein K3495_g615 [Podosphaera aphanis]|nr:hypothetical protein K3495_g615 [Podosphaera aphanis]